MSKELFDVVVVGGGVSGVYSAWRILAKNPQKKVLVVEASDHIGGRLLSVKPPGIGNMVAELGGMRILPGVQPLITNLLAYLDNDGVSSPIETYDFPVDEPGNISYLRGKYLRLSDFTDEPQEVPFNLTFQEFGKTAGELVINAIEQIVPGVTAAGLTEERRRALIADTRFDGKALHTLGFWDVLFRVMSSEAYQLGIDAGGYQTTMSNWNAADAIPWFLSDFGSDAKYLGFKQGFQQVPLELEKRVRALKGDIRLNTKLTGFDTTANGIEISLSCGQVIYAESLILAMPRKSLDLISGETPFLRQKKVQKLTSSVTPKPLFKLFTTYEQPWWLPAGVESGRTTTDLPVRQTYYWPTNEGKPAQSGPAMLMASYDDGLDVGFWDGFRCKRGANWEPGLLDITQPSMFKGSPIDEADSCDEWRENQAPTAMLEEVQRQLTLVHDLKYTPNVVDASFKDWGDAPFGGGWNAWNIGVDSRHVKQAILKPDSEHNVYICGEAYSDAQGWVEGALQTADMMLEQYFGITALPDAADASSLNK